MLCAYGPIIIGHREKEIDDAVIKRGALCMIKVWLFVSSENSLAATLNIMEYYLLIGEKPHAQKK